MVTLQKVAIVGASLAGLRAAESLRRLGYQGRLLLVGAEKHLPYDRPPLSKEILQGRWDVDRLALRKRPYQELALDLRLGTRATRLDVAARELALDDGTRERFDALVIASGAAPRRLPGQPALEGVHLLRSLDDSLALRAALERKPRVAVIGAGFIGAEVAASCRARGLSVTLVEPLPAPLARALGTEMGSVWAQLHLDHGVDLRCGVGVTAIEGAGRVERVVLSDGARVEVDLVVVGIGAAPETGWLEGSGLALGDGVICDSYCAAAPGIFAAGDVARWHNPLFDEVMRIEHWSNAVEQGTYVAERLAGSDLGAQPFAPVPFFWSDQYDAKIQFAGRMRGDDELRVVAGSLAQRKFTALYGRAGRLTGVLAMSRPRDLARYRRLIAERAGFADAVAAASAG
ncbi:MAG TPA: FAD-dependent oxidoreductase [Myxococcota bacterium]|nr:FAD-dependent oxidoreductase [Myxococcota bacterium]